MAGARAFRSERAGAEPLDLMVALRRPAAWKNKSGEAAHVLKTQGQPFVSAFLNHLCTFNGPVGRRLSASSCCLSEVATASRARRVRCRDSCDSRYCHPGRHRSRPAVCPTGRRPGMAVSRNPSGRKVKARVGKPADAREVTGQGHALVVLLGQEPEEAVRGIGSDGVGADRTWKICPGISGLVGPL